MKSFVTTAGENTTSHKRAINDATSPLDQGLGNPTYDLLNLALTDKMQQVNQQNKILIGA